MERRPPSPADAATIASPDAAGLIPLIASTFIKTFSDGTGEADTVSHRPEVYADLQSPNSLETDLAASCDYEPQSLQNPEQDRYQISENSESVDSKLDQPPLSDRRQQWLCTLLQNTLIPGTLVLNTTSLSFTAARSAHDVQKDGTSKAGHIVLHENGQSEKRKCWGILNEHTLSFHRGPTHQYFPQISLGLEHIRLVTPSRSTDGTSTFKSFSIILDERSYQMRAVSIPETHSWYIAVRDAVFRVHHGQALQISINLQHIIDLEEVSILQNEKCLTIRTLDDDEYFSVNEVFFCFLTLSATTFQQVKEDISRAMKEAAEHPSKVGHGAVNHRERLSAKIRHDISHDNEAKETSSPRTEAAMHSEQMSHARSSLSPSPAHRLGRYVRLRSEYIAGQILCESAALTVKLSDMWSGTAKHYDEGESIVPEGEFMETVERTQAQGTTVDGDHFRRHFTLPSSERLKASYFTYLYLGIPVYGKLYIGVSVVCFRSLLPGITKKLILPLQDIVNVQASTGYRFGYAGLTMIIKAYEELFLEFAQHHFRDSCMILLLKLKEKNYARISIASKDLPVGKPEDDDHALVKRESMESITPDSTIKFLASGVAWSDNICELSTHAIPNGSLTFTCLTIGSRGDIQPYIALCKRLAQDGHRTRIATHAEFGPWIESHGITFCVIDGDPTELMQICVKHGMFTISFLREASSKFRGWIERLLESSWLACQGSNVIIESPSAMAGVHIAEALRIPYFRAFSMPWTRTRAFPHAFAASETHKGGNYNYMSYVLIEQLFWNAIAGQVNQWRANCLHLSKTDLQLLKESEIPFLYNFSPSVVPPPLDYSEETLVTGYWFLEDSGGWKPPKSMTDFIEHARNDQKKLVYIGFGSIVVADAYQLTSAIVSACLKADVRVILSKGWSDRLSGTATEMLDLSKVPEIFCIESAPHHWLFTQVDAAVHHGGSGTTGASLRAGLPTVIKPFFGDQFFFGTRVEDLGVGIQLKQLTVTSLSQALWRITSDKRLIQRAKALGDRIRAERGVDTAVSRIYQKLSHQSPYQKTAPQPAPDQDPSPIGDEDAWTIVEDADSIANENTQVQAHDAAHFAGQDSKTSKLPTSFLNPMFPTNYDPTTNLEA